MRSSSLLQKPKPILHLHPGEKLLAQHGASDIASGYGLALVSNFIGAFALFFVGPPILSASLSTLDSIIPLGTALKSQMSGAIGLTLLLIISAQFSRFICGSTNTYSLTNRRLLWHGSSNKFLGEVDLAFISAPIISAHWVSRQLKTVRLPDWRQNVLKHAPMSSEWVFLAWIMDLWRGDTRIIGLQHPERFVDLIQQAKQELV